MIWLFVMIVFVVSFHVIVIPFSLGSFLVLFWFVVFVVMRNESGQTLSIPFKMVHFIFRSTIEIKMHSFHSILFTVFVYMFEWLEHDSLHQATLFYRREKGATKFCFWKPKSARITIQNKIFWSLDVVEN